ncbi:MAG TPA: hypothetical protein VID48_03315, partial [Solirubrobacteraceae bacterium]
MAMFALAVLVYPAVLAVLTLGSGLLLHRAACPLPASLLPVTGIATLIALSQIGTYLPGSAPATPYAMCVLCAAGLWFGRRELSSLARRWRQGRGLIIVMVLAYLAAIAPVLLAGRASFSSYMALADSAVHMLGADFLTRYGQHYGRLDLHNSYGLFINNYYNTNYPSGSDTLLGGSASLLGLPVIWAFQPFCAFVLASAAGPLLTLARRLGLQGGSAALAALCATLPALVYGFELIGSIKELTALAMILAIGVLVVEHRRWLWRGPTGAVPFAVLGAGGISALGVGFGAWILASLALLGVLVIRGVRAAEGNPGGVFALVAVGAITALVCSWPTWVGLSGSLRVATGIASTSNPGNLHKPLRAIQALGVWLGGSYKLPPHGVLAVLTYTLIAVACLAAALGVLRALRSGEYTLLGWLGATLIVWLAVSLYSTTWVNAKALMITSPVLVLLGWGGVAALRHGGRRAGATVLALALGCGVLASDALQYHDSVLAPTARYEELARIDTRFAGRGPTLFTDFDEYSLYVLRDLDVGGPDFVYPPPALQRLAGGHGRPVDLDRASPRALRGYPLIVTRRDPLASRPPVAYRLLWQGAYYQVWGRTSALPAAVAHLAL